MSLIPCTHDSQQEENLNTLIKISGWSPFRGTACSVRSPSPRPILLSECLWFCESTKGYEDSEMTDEEYSLLSTGNFCLLLTV